MEDRPIKVLVIMGSARKANTYRAAERIREILQEEAAVNRRLPPGWGSPPT
ncbi:hypothetical protein [Methanoculleus sp. UBA303]|uniref:hypothetical protein n=1 Tax=Methanoculleus sp. UBA303 TaxID=1915497 RepID=UPI0025FD6F72|nr:hypothetical protein [Methanoculleus sp. UBA303]MDD3932672.1 hypothetical protein [Methanoculleus sp.]